MSQLVSFLEAGMNSDIMSEVISQRSRNVERMEGCSMTWRQGLNGTVFV